ncbi:KAP family P-loop NTPase fold protein [Psychrobacter faecalis]|uniref:KAP family P-loop NTPase fold protein n=1 Tax=Psychrobacter faecalis TaxID=180588 RepID=UPI003FD10908
MTTENYSSDAPVSTKDEDIFSRWKFSERVAQVIATRRDPSSIVIGLYGKWGDGKTSVLNFIEQSLNANNGVICIKFNPWRFGTEDQLLMGFFNQIAEALDDKLETKGDTLKEIGKKVISPLASLAGIGGVGEIATSFISMPDINAFKSRTEQLLEKSQKRVLILIDDVDRLDKTEIHALFRLVKLTADFKYTSYILAFDKDIVASSLQDRYSTSQGNSGEAFLEKIIQVPLHLPYIDKQTLRNFCFQRVDTALELANIQLTEEQAQDFARNFVSAFDSCITTPRKAKLYGNILTFSLPILKGEVNPVDLMLIEGVRAFYPRLYESIRDNEKLFVGTFPTSSGSSYDADKDLIKTLIDNALSTTTSSNKEDLKELLKNLFPKLQAVYGKMHYAGDSHKVWTDNQRICSKNYFSRYFGYSVSPSDISDVAVTQVFQNINNWDEPYNHQANPLKDFITPKNAEKVIQKLRSQIGWNSDGYQPLILSIAQVGDIIPDTRTFLSFNPLVQSVVLIADMILNINKNEQIVTAKLALDNAPTLKYQTELFRWLYHSDNENPKPNCFSLKERNELGNHLGKRIFSDIETIDITSEQPDLVSCIFWILSEYVDKTRLNNYVELLVNSDSQAAYRIINAYIPTLTSLTNGTESKEGLDESNYRYLSNHLDTSIIFEAIKRDLPTLIINLNEYPILKSRDEDRELIIPQQFVWWYRKEVIRNQYNNLKYQQFSVISASKNGNIPFINNSNKQ